MGQLRAVTRLAGVDHLGLDFDDDGVTALPVGLEDVSTYPAITQELLNRGHKREGIYWILGGNVLRVMRESERVGEENN
jgi:membrane dipeptidase